MLSFKDLQRLEDMYYSVYKLMFPEHSYTSLSAMMLESLRKIEVGGKYIDFTAPDLDGHPVTLSQQIDGKVALIDLWASWCGPCRSEMKSLRRLYKDFEHKGLRVMSISLDDSREKWLKACQEEQLPWKSYRNPFGYKRDGIRADLGIEGIPYLVVLDREGRFVAKELHRNVLRKKVQDLLNSQREQVR